MRMLTLAMIVLVSSCAPLTLAEIVTGNDATVSVKAGKANNPGPVATKHCAKFGKSAALVGSTPIGIYGHVYIHRFNCV